MNKRYFLKFACLVLALFMICSCSSDGDECLPTQKVKIYVGRCPSPFADGKQTRTLTDSEGNVSWTDGDEILISIKSKNSAQYVTLTYQDGEWVPDMYIKPMPSADIVAFYAPTYQWNHAGSLETKVGRYAGAGEFIVFRSYGVNISQDGIYVDFCSPGIVRNYSRLRVYMGEKCAGGYLSLDGMTPAGMAMKKSITAPIQSDGCAYFYGLFDGNTMLTYTYEGCTTTKTTPTGGSVVGKGYFNNLTEVTSLFYVDLGLASGNKWANCNLDAPSSWLSGGYYLWGSTEPSVGFVSTEDGFVSQPTGETNANPLANIIRYTDSYLGTNAYKLPLASDPANKKLGANWHVPTYGDWKELVESCTWTWTSHNRVDGYRITSTNGNCIFLPAIGYYTSILIGGGKEALYLCSTVYNPNTWTVYSYFVSKSQKYFNTNSTIYSMPIRPVYSE